MVDETSIGHILAEAALFKCCRILMGLNKCIDWQNLVRYLHAEDSCFFKETERINDADYAVAA